MQKLFSKHLFFLVYTTLFFTHNSSFSAQNFFVSHLTEEQINKIHKETATDYSQEAVRALAAQLRELAEATTSPLADLTCNEELAPSEHPSTPATLTSAHSPVSGASAASSDYLRSHLQKRTKRKKGKSTTASKYKISRQNQKKAAALAAAKAACLVVNPSAKDCSTDNDPVFNPKTDIDPEARTFQCPLCPAGDKKKAIGFIQDHVRKRHNQGVGAFPEDLFKIHQAYTSMETIPTDMFIKNKNQSPPTYTCTRCSKCYVNSNHFASHFNTEHRTHQEVIANYCKFLAQEHNKTKIKRKKK